MNFIELSHRHADAVIAYNVKYNKIYNELKLALNSISEENLADDFYSMGLRRGKSLTKSINRLIKERLVDAQWLSEVAIFKPDQYKHPWRLDFAKGPFSVEVAFNHGEATAWNLMKPVIASEINHVETAVNTEIGIVILATEDLKKDGGFDGTVKTFESIENYLLPLMNYLTVPILIIGLEGPKSFKIIHKKHPHNNSKLGFVEYNDGSIKDELI